jgi:hypothetical protein
MDEEWGFVRMPGLVNPDSTVHDDGQFLFLSNIYTIFNLDGNDMTKEEYEYEEDQKAKKSRKERFSASRFAQLTDQSERFWKKYKKISGNEMTLFPEHPDYNKKITDQIESEIELKLKGMELRANEEFEYRHVIFK